MENGKKTQIPKNVARRFAEQLAHLKLPYSIELARAKAHIRGAKEGLNKPRNMKGWFKNWALPKYLQEQAIKLQIEKAKLAAQLNTRDKNTEK